ncbi:RagB/SusD family nutrient uptake outer membrane protein [Sphingobacterium bovistauri]|uniref:RagB/SusD family nutrient uptake outer membrane protein n=1 Tax=Sphingobacterium bovistauri TaxID=2781959 RepID=A0ABS7Z4Q0_9SPHI|nr:RagB/SusD family nutrient uptake outer membrane protein [Sphingobacterium bovistauri]MCA5003865.1 RagB/SusD family nutrient uptake outer membrane protein [Sphingobacterium bovistauri]
MRKLLYICFSLVILISSSCQKWLDVLPPNEQITDRYWTSKEEVEAVLGAAYVSLQKSVNTMIVWGEARGNTLSLGGFISADLIMFKNLTLLPSNGLVKWSSFYEIINYSNMVIKYAPDVVDRDPSFNVAVMQSFLSEAYYLRAFSYFYLVRNFGEVPLLTEPYMNDSQNYELAKSTQQEVYAQIISDLNMASQNSKDIWPTVWETKGRSTTNAIQALLADVYLWTENYDQAIIACNKVLESGRVGLIQGMVNGKNHWFTMFNPGNSNESIFEVQFDVTKNQTNNFLSIFGNSNNWIISPYGVQLFQENQEDIRGAGSSYSNSDLKLWKYIGAEGGTTVARPQSDQNWIIYRVADVYLMKAEALIMKGTSSYPAALELITEVRTRAQISRPLSTSESQIDMLDILLKERAREFLGEGKRWYDLLRVAKRNSYEHKEYLINEVLLGTSGGSAPVIRSILMNENAHYLPIHQDEIKYNRLLVQNPYYAPLN